MGEGRYIVALVVGIFAAVGLAVDSASAQLVLFPFTNSAVQDGGTNDATGATNDMIVVDPNNPIDVPNHPGLKFSGMVEHATGGTINVGQAQGLRALRVTEIPTGTGLPGAGSPAVLHNTTASTITVSAPLDWVIYDYPTLDPAGNAGATDLSIRFTGPLDTVPASGSLASINHTLALSVRATTWWWQVTGQPDSPIGDTWENVAQATNAPLSVLGSASGLGDYNIDPGVLTISLDKLILGPGERFEFPASVTGGLVPEPTTALLLSLGGLTLLRRRRPAAA